MNALLRALLAYRAARRTYRFLGGPTHANDPQRYHRQLVALAVAHELAGKPLPSGRHPGDLVMTESNAESRVTGVVSDSSYGIVASVREIDATLRLGAKCWLCEGTGGAGWDRFQWSGLSRGGRVIRKWASTHRFDSFRAAWIPDHMRDRVTYYRGSRAEMEARAIALEAHAARMRADHPNRLHQRPGDRPCE